MSEQPFSEDIEAHEADAAEQALPVDAAEAAETDENRGVGAQRTPPWDADPADAAEQAAAVPLDEDEYR